MLIKARGSFGCLGQTAHSLFLVFQLFTRPTLSQLPWNKWGSTLATLCLALSSTAFCLWVKSPLPWMLGPLISVAVATICGFPTQSWRPFRNIGQLVIGCSLGLYFSPEIGHLIVSLWWVIVLGILWALLVGAGFGNVLYRLHGSEIPGLTRSACFFSGAIGGASEMTNLAEREKGRTDLVAAAHSLRVMLIAIVIPFGLKALGFQGNPVLGPVAKDIVPWGLAVLFLLSILIVWLLNRWGRANPWFLGGLSMSMALSLSGHVLSAVPTWMINISQLLIGISLGVQFSGDFIKSAPKWMLSVCIGTMSLIAVCSLFALGISELSGIDHLTMVLGTAPGGIAEMAITAKVLHLGVPLVTTLQVCRLIAVLILVEPLYRYLYPKEAKDQNTAST